MLPREPTGKCHPLQVTTSVHIKVGWECGCWVVGWVWECVRLKWGLQRERNCGCERVVGGVGWGVRRKKAGKIDVKADEYDLGCIRNCDVGEGTGERVWL